MNDSIFEICPKCNSLPLVSIKRKADVYYVHIKCTCGCDEDYYLNDYMGIIRNTISTFYASAIGENHKNNEDNKATTYCTSCKLWICDNCLKQHSIWLPNHITTNNPFRPSDFCPVHQTKIEMYCTTCNKPLCSLDKKDHANHSVVQLASIALSNEESKDIKETF